jgi:hypothetical protein
MSNMIGWEEFILEKREVMPCPRCGINDSTNCGYSVRDPWHGDYDCEAPENDGEEELECDDCHHIYCENCSILHGFLLTKWDFEYEHNG